MISYSTVVGLTIDKFVAFCRGGIPDQVEESRVMPPRERKRERERERARKFVCEREKKYVCV